MISRKSRFRNKKTLRKNRRAKHGGVSTSPMVSSAAPIQQAYPVFKPGPGQFGYQNPGAVDLTGNFTEYSIGNPLFGIRGYTQPGASLSTMQQIGPTGLPQNVAIAAGLLIPGRTSMPATSFDPTKLPPDYYGALGFRKSDTALNTGALQAAYNLKKNIGTNAQKQLVKNAYNTLSDPAKRYQYDAAVNQYLTLHPPSVAQLMQMAQPNPSTGSNPPPFNPTNALKFFSWLPGFSSALQAPIKFNRR